MRETGEIESGQGRESLIRACPTTDRTTGATSADARAEGVDKADHSIYAPLPITPAHLIHRKNCLMSIRCLFHHPTFIPSR